jgi:hypothetical protein
MLQRENDVENFLQIFSQFSDTFYSLRKLSLKTRFLQNSILRGASFSRGSWGFYVCRFNFNLELSRHNWDIIKKWMIDSKA